MENYNVTNDLQQQTAVSKVKGHRYEKLPGFANISGQLYEIKMAALLFLRAFKTTHNFLLATNMKAAGSFDDVLLTLGDQTVFLQLKHRENITAKIRTSQLIQLGGDFSLLKYCSSYFKVKQQWEKNVDLKFCNRCEDSLFIVYTNASMVEGIGNEVTSSELQSVISSGGKCIQFTEDDKEIFNVFNNLKRYKQLLTEATTKDEVPDSPELLDAVKKLYNNSAKSIPSKNELTKLLKNIESLGDLSDFREFLSCLRFCTEQADEKKLHSFVVHELITVCGKDIMFEKFMFEVQNWWRNSREFLTEQTQFWQDIMQLCIANLSKCTLNKILDLGIKFNHEEIQRVKAFMSSGSRVLHVISNFSLLSCRKFQQSLGIRLLVDGITLLTNLSEVVAAWKFGVWNEVLLVTGGFDNRDIVTRFNEVLKHCLGKRLVLVTTETEKVAFQFYQESAIETITDSFDFNQFDLESKEKVLSSQVNFQGFTVPLKSLTDKTVLESSLTCDIVKEFLSKNILSIGQKLNDVEECYIQRKFVRKERANTKVLFDDNKSCLAISGISFENLKKMLSLKKHVIKFERDKHVETSGDELYFLIKDAEDFNVLSNRYNVVHWFYYSGESFMWKKSKVDDMKQVTICLEPDAEDIEYCNVQDINDLQNKFVLVAAEPGMGKSTELTHVAMEIKKDDPTIWVVMINLNDHTNYLAEEHSNSLELLLRAGNFKTTFERTLFKHHLFEGNNTVVMFDSFDEISPLFSEVVYKLITELSGMKIKTVWIASRPVTKKHLEDKLCTLSFSLKSFTENEQREYFLKFWKVPSYCSYNLEPFIQELLRLFSKCLNDSLRKFAGIPLHTKMLAEAFQNEVKHYCESGEILLPQKLNVLELYRKFTETKWKIFYEKYKVDVTNVEMHYTYQKLRSKLQKDHTICALVSLLGNTELQQIECLEDIEKKNKKSVEKFLEGNERIGLIVNVNHGKAVFVHRTFMEYFVAIWLYNNRNSHVVKSLYLDENFQVVRHFFDSFLTEKFELHVAVMNMDKDLVDFLLSQKKVNINEIDEGGRTALHLAVIYFIEVLQEDKDLYFVSFDIIRMLLDNGADTSKADNITGLKPIQMAEKFIDEQLIDLLLERGAEGSDLIRIPKHIESSIALNPFCGDSDENVDAILESAAKYGFVNILRFMLENGIDADYEIGFSYCDTYEGSVMRCLSMMHVAAANGHLNIIKLLLEFQADIDDDSGIFSFHTRTPLMCAAENGKFEVVEYLINAGADVNAKNSIQSTALNLAAEQGQFHIMKFLIEHGADVKSCDYDGDTSLHAAAYFGDIDATCYLLDAGIFVDVRNRALETPLLIAARNEKWDLVLFLIQYGADHTAYDCDNDTLFHYFTCDIFKHDLIPSNIGESINKMMNNFDHIKDCDKDGNTVLHYAVESENPGWISYLIERGLDVNITNKFQETPLMKAAKYEKWEVVNLLLMHGAQVNGINNSAKSLSCYIINACKTNNYDKKMICDLLTIAVRTGNTKASKLLSKRCKNLTFSDNSGNSLLHYAAEARNKDIVSYLLDNSLDVEHKNLLHETPLLFAAKKESWKVVSILLQHGVDVKVSDALGNTAMHYAASQGNMKYVLELYRGGLNVDSKNNDLVTPLMAAASSGNLNTVELLIKLGATVGACCSKGNTLLHFAAHSNAECVLFFLGIGFDINIKGTDKLTPLLIAARLGNLELVRILKENGADMTACDKDGNTALHYAAVSGSVECVSYLLNTDFSVNIKNQLQLCPLIMATRDGKLDVMKYLLEQGADKMTTDTNGSTLIHFACLSKNLESISYLIDMGSDVNASNKSQATPLHLAILKGNTEAAKLLLKLGADINATDDSGNNALHCAVLANNVDCASILLNCGIEMETKNIKLVKPLDLAMALQHLDVTVLLKATEKLRWLLKFSLITGTHLNSLHSIVSNHLAEILFISKGIR